MLKKMSRKIKRAKHHRLREKYDQKYRNEYEEKERRLKKEYYKKNEELQKKIDSYDEINEELEFMTRESERKVTKLMESYENFFEIHQQAIIAKGTIKKIEKRRMKLVGK